MSEVFKRYSLDVTGWTLNRINDLCKRYDAYVEIYPKRQVVVLMETVETT